MKTILGLFGIFAGTIFFLAIEINHKPIFGHIYKLISPMTKATQQMAESFFDNSVDKTQHYSKKLFENSVPKIKDSVRSKMSSIKQTKNHPQEAVTVKEKQELDELIKSYK